VGCVGLGMVERGMRGGGGMGRKELSGGGRISVAGG